MIYCQIPLVCNSEVRYTIEYVINRLFEDDIVFLDSNNDCVIFSDGSNREIQIATDFFQAAGGNWLGCETLPKHVAWYYDKYSGNTLPVIFGQPTVQVIDSITQCDIDIFGTIFFMLSRYEEAISGSVLDDHKRFPSSNSVAYTMGFLERPIVDEYIMLFKDLIVGICPDLITKELRPKTWVTCDVDWPFDPLSRSIKKTFIRSLGDLIKRKNIKSFLFLWWSFIGKLLGINGNDDFRERIFWIMEENERLGNKVAFFFIALCTDKKYDSNFDFGSSEMRQLLREIHSRGHEIGLHPGYHCFNNPTLFQQSTIKFKSVLKEEGIAQEAIGGRMHFLRWDAKITPKLWQDNGFDYDSTLSFAERSGFRCGTCHPFPMYDLVNRCSLNVVQRPLINMESTIISRRYEGFGHTEYALERFMAFKERVDKHGGEYVLLWHNTQFTSKFDELIYKKLIK